MTAPRLWGRFRCGGCGRGFTADPAMVPVFPAPIGGRPWPCCKTCWELRGRMRKAIGEPEQERPACYPEDYPAA